MNEIINKCLLAGNNFRPEMHHLLKTNKEYKNLNKQEIHNTFIKTN